MSTTVKHIIMSLIVGLCLTAFSYGVAIVLGWVTTIAWLEAFAVFTSYSCTYLCVMQSRWNYPIGIIGTALYSFLFLQWGMPALALFNLYLVFSLIYGWFNWGSDDNTRPVSNVSLNGYLGYALFGALVLGGFLGANIWLNPEGITTLNPIDVGLAVASGIAQLMLDRKKLETWFVWTAVNIVSIPFFFTSGLYLVAFQYIFFLANAGWGYWMWKKSMKKDPVSIIGNHDGSMDDDILTALRNE